MELPGYTIEKQIGKGGMARVFLAIHQGLHREVAIKVMNPQLDEDSDFSDRFMREARIVANLSHPNIVTVYDVNKHGDYHYIAMEYLRGGITLDHKIKDGLDTQSGLQIIKETAAALSYSHEKGIVHRDIKPENIMFRENGTAVLTDFGIARASSPTTKMTATGIVIGTPHYMSPEQAQGLEVGAFSDIYSLGIVLYEILTGEVPYNADSTIAVVLKQISEPVPTLEGELAVFQPLLDRMMAKTREERYQSCEQVIEDINSLCSGGEATNATMIISNATIINPARSDKITQKFELAAGGKPNKLIPIVAVSIFIVAAAAAGYFYKQSSSTDEERIEPQVVQKELTEEQLRQQDEKKLADLQREIDNIKAKQEEEKKLAEVERELAALKALEGKNTTLEDKQRELAELKAKQNAEAKELARLEELMKQEEAKTQERARLAKIKRQQIESQKSRLGQQKEQARLSELKKQQELEKKQRLIEAARAQKEQRIIEDAREQEEQRLIEEARIQEQQRLAEEARIQEELRLAEEARLQELEQEAKNSAPPEQIEKKKRRSFGGF